VLPKPFHPIEIMARFTSFVVTLLAFFVQNVFAAPAEADGNGISLRSVSDGYM
jgi:hypothetical protein